LVCLSLICLTTRAINHVCCRLFVLVPWSAAVDGRLPCVYACETFLLAHPDLREFASFLNSQSPFMMMNDDDGVSIAKNCPATTVKHAIGNVQYCTE